MPTTRRSRTVRAAPDAAWRIVGDPRTQPRWWPKVQRVEAVTDDAFTRVYGTRRGRPLRGDFTVADRGERRATWVWVVEGSPFAGVLRSASTRVAVEPAPDGRSRILLEQRQVMRGLSRLGGALVRIANRRQLDDALDALETLL